MANRNRVSSQNNFYWIYLVGFFLVVIQIINVFPLWSDPADWGKAIFSRIIISVMLFVFLWQIISKKIDFSYIKSKIKSAGSPFYLLVSLFSVYLLATILSVNWHFSLWGNPSRAGGFVSFSFYIILSILAFLIIKEKGWKKILNFLIIISLFVCLIAIFQQFGIFGKYIIPVVSRPVSTIGNPILLSIYLLLVTFFTFTFGLIEKSAYKKIFYFFSVFLFLFVSIFLVQTRGAYLGLAIGFLWFLFAYPKKINKLKVISAVVLILVLFGMYSAKVYLDSHLYLYNKMPPILSNTVDRMLGLFEGTKITEARTSAWWVSWSALKEKPIFGYGPENFMIAFDKYYDPSLPKIGQIAPGEELTQWFDRAHNFIFDVSITGGLPALIIYLSLFGALIWQLQKTKYANSSYLASARATSENANEHMRIYSQNAIICHSLQATFIGYLVALLSSFDSVSTYLVSFLLIGYSLHLINNSNVKLRTNYESVSEEGEIIEKLHKYRAPIIALLFIILVWFIWVCNLKPFYINKQMNEAILYANLEEEIRCEKAFNIMNTIYPSISNNIIDNYLAQRSTFVIYRCINHLKEHEPEKLIGQNIQILKDTIEKNPQYVTNWILIGEYTDALIKEKNKLTENVFIETEETKKLKEEADYYFKTALQLSPRRQLILKDWADVNIITAEYKKAEEKLQKCIELNPSYASCYWYMALNKGYQKDYEGFNKFREIAKENNYGVELIESLQELINMYIRNSDYNGLAEVYPKLIPLTSDPLEKAQLHASLADTYRNLGDIQRAREEVLKILDIIPLLPKELQDPAKKDVELFLEILK